MAHLQEQVKELENLCYSIAHDLQTPLRNMRNFTTLLNREYAGVLDVTGQQYTHRIDAAAERMQRLVRDFLTYGQISHTKPACTSVSLNGTLRDVLSACRSEIERKHASVHIHSPLPNVWANRGLLDRVLTNVIDNAIKYAAPERAPHIEIHATHRRESIRLWIEDNGLGIERRHIGRVFRMFERFQANGTEIPGTGVGLAIVSKAMEKMGGRVGVISTPGEGSRFWLDFLAPPEID